MQCEVAIAGVRKLGVAKLMEELMPHRQQMLTQVLSAPITHIPVCATRASLLLTDLKGFLFGV